MKKRYKSLLIIGFLSTAATSPMDINNQEEELTKICLKKIDEMFEYTEKAVKRNEDICYKGGSVIPYRLHSIKNDIKDFEKPSFIDRLLPKRAQEKNDAANRIFQKIEQRYQKNAEKLMREMPYFDFTDEHISNIHETVGRMPYILCINGLKAEDTNCEKINKNMLIIAKNIMVER